VVDGRGHGYSPFLGFYAASRGRLPLATGKSFESQATRYF
jgi:hypothetical protein